MDVDQAGVDLRSLLVRVCLTPTRRTLFSQTVEILVLSLRARSATARVLGALALRAMDSDGVFGSRNV